MQRLRGWLGLTWSERGQLLAALLGLPLVATLLSLAGYSRSRRWLEAVSGGKARRMATDGELQRAQRFAQLAAVAGEHGLVTATCLRQALLVYWWLRRQSLDPELKIGVRRQDGVFDAHAWVELQGQSLAQRDLTHTPIVQ